MRFLPNFLSLRMNHDVRKRTFDMSVHLQSDQRSSLGVFRIAMTAKFLHADNEDSNQTARMRSLI